MSLMYALVLLLPALAFGQTVNLKPYNLTATAMFLQTDTDLSGDIDRPELDASFRDYDTDRNGRVSRTEYMTYLSQHTPSLAALHDALFDIYDVDNDHILDHHDYDNFFGLMDGNGDGFVSHFEYVRYWTILLQDLEHLHLDN
uniref:EF-hand domain-containing protein n=1 Tax=Biomphalaria glabrata TaxID=6526 RepID=A0A2C9KN49_BIOGL